ncbi:uncharacterized protein PV06_03312 [Exophiala oligosperma]|uniref:Kinetochore protein Sos7 coiled-coil domain-containing protein n=1 Tax=Exophiala oligosperma TaxID=215243 RepID=A0A0D2DPW2_9EURO|nr:uncharacterized protein PV06_03312 [Exophiala oligosperma]KIW44873.1 hypothetical protein PV06_03312 [Exophiala oligosperma]
MSTPDYASTLSTLRAQQADQPLSILALAEPITASQAQAQSQFEPGRRSDASTSSSYHNASSSAAAAAAAAAADTMADTSTSSLQLTPASLAADLAHYKDLFSKLRFSYLEQVTKEKYLRSIVGDPPSVVGHEENAALEARLGEMKVELKDKKQTVDGLVADMEAQARVLAGVYEDVNTKIGELDRASPEVERLRDEVEELRRELARRQGEDGKRRESDPRMNMSLDETRRALEERNSRMAAVEDQIRALEREVPSKVARLEEVDRELTELDRRRNESVRLAVEGKRRKENGGRDEVEELGKWYRSQEVVLKGLGLDVEA